MSIEAMKLAAEFNRYFTSANGVDVRAKVSVTRDEWRVLFTAIQQAEAQQPATPDPVVPDSSEHLRVIASLGAALRRLSFAAQTTGGTAGPDAELQSAIVQAEQALSLGGIWQAMSATPEPAGYLYDFKYDDEIVRDWFTQNIDEIQFRPATCLNIRPLYAHPAPSVPADVVPVYWEWRHLSTHPDTVDFGKWSEWKRVEARSAIHTIEDALAEFRAYIAQGYKYELRALYTRPEPSVPDDVARNAERWRHAISDGGNQSMSFIDIFNGWDGDGDFVEAFDAAMLAAK